MSYEGWVEYLCENGHYHRWDCSDPDQPYNPDDFKCSDCGAGRTTMRYIDQTNGYMGDSMREELKVLSQDKCECCGAATGPAVYAWKEQ